MFSSRKIAHTFNRFERPRSSNLNSVSRRDERQILNASAQPEEVQTAIAIVQSLVQKIGDTKCCGCGRNFTQDVDIEDVLSRWHTKSRDAVSLKDSTICARKCSLCSASTCLGCGQRPGSNTQSYTGRQVNVCCSEGRLVTFWMALCRFDMLYPDQTSQNSQSANMVSKMPGSFLANGSSSTPLPKGVGYGHGAQGAGTGIYQGYSQWSYGGTTLDTPSLQVKAEDTTNDATACWLMQLLTDLLPSAGDGELPVSMPYMIQLSLIIDKIAELIRNDSLDTVMQRFTIYRKSLDFIDKLGARAELRHVITEDRYSKTRSPGLQTISLGYRTSRSHTTSALELPDYKDGKDASLFKSLEGLYQSSTVIIRSPSNDASLQSMCQHVRDVHDNLVQPTYYFEGVPTLTPAEQWSQFHKTNALSFSDEILKDLLPNMKTEADTIARQLQTSRDNGRNKRILTECASMKTSLDDGTFVIVAESRPDCMRALIVGPSDTAYSHGLFEFDIVLPGDYPRSPPKVYFRYPPQFNAEINPNLHASGLVCLSLLGTWYQGDATSRWQPGLSTLLQVLVSIRAMVFTSDALHNEPTLEGHIVADEVRRFNEHVQLCVVRGWMLGWLDDKSLREGPWRDVVRLHFSIRGEETVRIAQGWAAVNHKMRSWDGRLDFRLGGPRYVANRHRRDLVRALEDEVGKVLVGGENGEEDPEMMRALIESLSVK